MQELFVPLAVESFRRDGGRQPGETRCFSPLANVTVREARPRLGARDVPLMAETDIAVVEAVIGSDLYRQSLRLREAILRAPLGLSLTQEELADDVTRQHFCAIFQGIAVGTVSLKPLDEATLQLKQMAVAEDRRRERIGARLLTHAEVWGRGAGFRLMVLHARIGADGFYARFGYLAEGDPFEENTLPHVKMSKPLG